MSRLTTTEEVRLPHFHHGAVKPRTPELEDKLSGHNSVEC